MAQSGQLKKRAPNRHQCYCELYFRYPVSEFRKEYRTIMVDNIGNHSAFYIAPLLDFDYSLQPSPSLESYFVLRFSDRAGASPTKFRRKLGGKSSCHTSYLGHRSPLEPLILSIPTSS